MDLMLSEAILTAIVLSVLRPSSSFDLIEKLEKEYRHEAKHSGLHTKTSSS
jgi:hypothetical protein